MSKSVTLPRLTLIESYEVFETVLRRLHPFARWCMIVPLPDVSNVFALDHMMPNAIHCVFVQCVRKLFCNSLFSAFVNSFPWFIDWLSGAQTSCRSGKFADGTSVARLIDAVFQILSSNILIVVGHVWITFGSLSLEERLRR